MTNDERQQTAHLRIAWTGPVGHEGGPWFATTLLRSLLALGHQVDLYVRGDAASVPSVLTCEPGLAVISRMDGWQWARWYSRTMTTAFLTSAVARVRTYVGLRRELSRRHRRDPYDVLFQLSQPETFVSRRALRTKYPPLVVHPCSHAAGELRWLRAEWPFAQRYESRSRYLMARSYLAVRAQFQGGEARKAALVIGPSRRFLELFCADYGVPAERTAVLRHPIDLERFTPGPIERPQRPMTLLFVSRLSTRKGLELVVGLSHRLADLEGRVRIEIYGGPTMWSDYSRMLEELNPATSSFHGSLPAHVLVQRYHDSHALVLPSRYEPGALVVGEALATGLPVVVSDEVGPGEVIDPGVCRQFADGDLDAFEHEVRRLLDDLEVNETHLRETAVKAARTLFAPERIGPTLDAHLQTVVRPA